MDGVLMGVGTEDGAAANAETKLDGAPDGNGVGGIRAITDALIPHLFVV